MSRILLVGRLAARDLRRRPAQAVLLLLAITAATATLSLALALNGVTNHPYQQTRAATNGPDLVAQLAAFDSRGPVTLSQAHLRAEVKTLTSAPGVARYGGPYPVASALLQANGIAVGAQVEGRPPGVASIDQPELTAGRWISQGGVVLERTFATALGVGVGDRIRLDGRSFLVTGTAVTAAAAPYPNLCYAGAGGCVFTMHTTPPGVHLASFNVGQAWVTDAAALALGSPQAPLSYVMELKLRHPASAEAFASRYYRRYGIGPYSPNFVPWQNLESAAGLLVQDEQSVLAPGALLAALLAIASVTVLAGGRMAERTRRVGLLKAVGCSPGLVAAVLLAENLALALAASAAGLLIGWLTAPLITSPGAGLVGAAGAPSLTAGTAGLAVAVALAVALASTLVPAIRAARTSTVSALANLARAPRRRPRLIAISARLPVPVLLGLRMVARRLRRAVLGAASTAVTSMGIVAVLAFRATVDRDVKGLSTGRLGDPVLTRDGQMLIVITIVVLALAGCNAIFAAWATVLDSRRSVALARALGASPQQVTAAVVWAQVLPAVPGVLLGIPLGLGLFDVANGGGQLTVPPVWWLAAAVLGTLLVVAVLASIPARLGGRRPAAGILQAETA
jgi:ABC-type lipoprotein release transport system permease subunit